jgi:hypothetical protein
MVWKTVINPSTGTSAIFGGNDFNRVTNMFNGNTDADGVDMNSVFRLRSGKGKLANPSNTFVYTINTGSITANRNINVPLLTGDDQVTFDNNSTALTNKTIVAGSNSISGIADANIASHTSTKITITDKTHLPTSAVYNDQANTFGAFDQTFRSSNFKINNPANTFAYLFAGSAITAGRTITIPLLTGNDQMTTDAFNTTLTNKSMSGSSNTFTNIPKSAFSGTTAVFTDQANTYGDFDQVLRSSRLKVRNPANTFSYLLAGSAITADRTITWPLLTGNDTVVTQAFTQSLTNKTLDNTNAIQNTMNGAIYTIFIAGTTVKARNNITGIIDYTADNTVNAVTCINSAAANIKNLANVDTQYGGVIEISEGVYKCTTNVDLTQPTTLRHGIILRGHGWGTVLNYVPGSALTDAISTRGTANGIENLRIKLNANVVNAIHIKSETVWTNNEYRGSSGNIEGVVIEAADFAESPGTFAATTGQVGIFQDSPTQTVAFFWKIHNNVFRVLDTAILSTGPYSTSMFIEKNVFEYCKTCVDLERNQHNVHQNWMQGSPGTTMIGVRLRGTAQYNNISMITSEIMNNTTDVATVQLDSGASNNIIENINNGYENNGSYVHSKVILDNSASNTNYISYYSAKLSRRVVYGIQTINKKAETGVGEIIQEWKVDDNTDTVIKMDNWATTDALFAPRLYASNLHGNTSGNASKALLIESEILTAADSGSDPVGILDARLSNVSAIATRPLYRIANNLSAVVDFYATKVDLTTKKLVNAVVDASTNTLQGVEQEPVVGKQTGKLQVAGNAVLLDGILFAHTSPQTPTAAYDTTEGITAVYASAATSGINVGLVSPTAGVGIGRRLFGGRVKIRWKIDSTTTARLYFGLTSATALPISDTPLATTDNGIIVGWSTTDTTYQIYHNDGATSVTKDAITGAIAKDAAFHTVEISWPAAGNMTVTFDGTAQTISADLPATTANLFLNAVGQTSAATARTVTIHGIWAETDK